ESGLIEFISHTHDHKDLIKIPNREIREDFEKSRNFMKKWGFNYRGVVYPFGNYNDRVLSVAKEFFDYSPGALGSTVFNSMVVTPPINNYTLPRQNINKASLEEIKGLIDETVEKNGWLILLGHIDQDDATEQDYRNIIEYALSKDVEIVKMDEGMKAHGNIAQFGGTNNYPETIITSEGDIIGEKTFPIQYLGQNGVVLNDSPQDKKLIDKITYSYINPEEKEDFPEESGGWLITNAVVGDSFSYQEYHLYHSNTIYRRWWMPSGSWSSWELVNPFNIASVNKFDGMSGVNDFPRGVTINRIQRQNSDGLPNNEAGVLTTTITSYGTEPGWNYQEFIEYNTSDKYIRNANTNGDWE